ncbi:MAG: hypothetical protein B7Z74_05205, partial [Deltaproteobacteria bacterium 21-66-5]
MTTEKEKSRQAEAQAVEGASLLDEIVQATKISPQDEAYSIAGTAGIHASGHTGEKIGVIGAVAAVG